MSQYTIARLTVISKVTVPDIVITFIYREFLPTMTQAAVSGETTTCSPSDQGWSDTSCSTQQSTNSCPSPSAAPTPTSPTTAPSVAPTPAPTLASYYAKFTIELGGISTADFNSSAFSITVSY